MISSARPHNPVGTRSDDMRENVIATGVIVGRPSGSNINRSKKSKTHSPKGSYSHQTVMNSLK